MYSSQFADESPCLTGTALRYLETAPDAWSAALSGMEDHREPTLLAVAFEAFRRQALPSCGPENVLVTDTEPFLEPRIEDRALEKCGAGRVRVRLGRHVEPTRARAIDQGEQDGRGAESHTRHVHDMQRRAGRRCVRNHLLHGSNAAGV